jgi:type IV pilus assembly protein PilY1
MAWEALTGDASSSYATSNVDYYNGFANTIYYEPNTRYLPGVKIYDTTATSPGTSYSIGNSTYTAAKADPYRSPTANGINLAATCYADSATSPTLPLTSNNNCKTSSSGSYTNLVNKYAFFNKFNGTGNPPTPSGNAAYGATSTTFTRVEILPGGAPFARAITRTDCAAITATANGGCTYVEEMTNFANWYSYYRSRILSMKTVMGRAFAGLDTNYNIGFSTINDNGQNTNSNGDNFLNVLNFTPANKVAWYNDFYLINPGGSTPLQEALHKVGEYYRTGKMGYSPETSVDPVKNSCQMNFAILSTDGYWNQSYNSTGDVDGANVPTLPTTALVPDPMTSATYKLATGQKWPAPFLDPNKTKDTLADVAASYWVRDLRPSTACTTGGVDVCTNNVPASPQDPASWQHMTTFTMGLGANGTLPFIDNYLDSVENGTKYPCSDPATVTWTNNIKYSTAGFYHDLTCHYTYPLKNYYPNAKWPAPPQGNQPGDDPTTVDDLWHAAVNGHGQYFSAKDPASLSSALTDILNSIDSRSSASAAVTVSNPIIVKAGDAIAYQSTYRSGTWTGDLAAYPVLLNGTVNTSAPIWSPTAQKQLELLSPSSRLIVTYSGNAGTGQGVPFEPYSASATAGTTLSSAQLALLNTPAIYTPPGPSDGANVVAYLRGDRSREGEDYRTRSTVLGDTVDAEPLLTQAPNKHYIDSGYTTFVSTNATRKPTVFQGANDGMMHAFDAATGAENWAYIPNLVLPNLNKLTLLSGFTHHFYVDGAGFVGDVDFNRTYQSSATGTDWHTILVSGLGKGGNGFFALDVTTPQASSEANAAAKVLWEFPNSATSTTDTNNIGLSFARPIIVKTAAAGWVVLVTSGYNNGADTGGNGKGYLFVLNAKTGAVISAISTGVGDNGVATGSTGPSGLAKISAYVENSDVDNTVTYVYGGDLFGNLWRFDLTGTTVAGWNVAKLATLVDSTGIAQPVTTEPELGSVGSKRFVYVGTGKYLGDSDVSSQQTQTIYGLIDDLTATPTISPLRTNLQQQTILNTSTSTQRQISNNGIATTARGWYLDLMPPTGTSASERANTNPALALGTLVFTTNIPNKDPCSPGGSSWMYMLNYQNGGQVSGSAYGAVSLGNVLASAPTLINIKGSGNSNEVKVLVRTSDSMTITQGIPININTGANRRVSWREVIQQ